MRSRACPSLELRMGTAGFVNFQSCFQVTRSPCLWDVQQAVKLIDALCQNYRGRHAIEEGLLRLPVSVKSVCCEKSERRPAIACFRSGSTAASVFMKRAWYSFWFSSCPCRGRRRRALRPHEARPWTTLTAAGPLSSQKLGESEASRWRMDSFAGF